MSEQNQLYSEIKLLSHSLGGPNALPLLGPLGSEMCNKRNHRGEGRRKTEIIKNPKSLILALKTPYNIETSHSSLQTEVATNTLSPACILAFSPWIRCSRFSNQCWSTTSKFYYSVQLHYALKCLVTTRFSPSK